MSAGPEIGRGFERTPRSCIVASPMASNCAGADADLGRGGWAGRGSAPGRLHGLGGAARPGGPSARRRAPGRSAFTPAFQASTAGSMTHEVIPCGTPKPPPSVWPMAWLAPSPRPALAPLIASHMPNWHSSRASRSSGSSFVAGRPAASALQPALGEGVGVGRALGIAELLDRMVDGLHAGREPELRAASRASAADPAPPRAAPAWGGRSPPWRAGACR